MDDLTVRDRAHLTALESTFPGWRITVEDGGWHAVRHSPPTEVQRAAGLVEHLSRPSPIEMSAALAAQLGILVRMGAA
ncbi:hypothetical protein [Spongiactinospora sp. TRM90649]|uniref:hypothetical protein n=1 Tax=Spongiactinospora sp. TRM90649 TaxID=3031114 RepID=UPI0023F93CEE|nr:hypothetical protein [Spongiactinospora sp. TRM90649]MDF5757756.1 hypothetical protein [Spongiactinospora sp. TRM90649]